MTDKRAIEFGTELLTGKKPEEQREIYRSKKLREYESPKVIKEPRDYVDQKAERKARRRAQTKQTLKDVAAMGVGFIAGMAWGYNRHKKK